MLCFQFLYIIASVPCASLNFLESPLYGNFEHVYIRVFLMGLTIPTSSRHALMSSLAPKQMMLDDVLARRANEIWAFAPHVYHNWKQ